MGFGYVVLYSSISKYIVFCCVLLIFGFLLGVEEEGSFGDLSYYGIFLGVSSSLMQALSSILVKKHLSYVNNKPFRLNMYNNVNAMFLFIPLIVISGELNVLVENYHKFSISFFIKLFISGFFAIAIGMAGMLQIEQTSPLTHNISATAKSCVQTVISVFINGESKSFMWWISNCIALIASALYAQIRRAEMRKQNLLMLKKKLLDV